jgi:hypothetical protein
MENNYINHTPEKRSYIFLLKYLQKREYTVLY